MIINYCLSDEIGQYSFDVNFKDEGIEGISYTVEYDKSLNKATLFVDGEEDEEFEWTEERLNSLKWYIQRNNL